MILTTLTEIIRTLSLKIRTLIRTCIKCTVSQHTDIIGLGKRDKDVKDI